MVLPRTQISVVIRLLRQQKFVVRVKNSVVPPSNEFCAQAVETALTFLAVRHPIDGGKAIFAVFSIS
jgi:hypothetical protein